jgi:hypothetical protein
LAVGSRAVGKAGPESEDLEELRSELRELHRYYEQVLNNSGIALPY